MKTYNREIRDRADLRFERTFNNLNFELLKQVVGEDNIIDLIMKPNNIVLEDEARGNFDDSEWAEMNEDEREEAISDHYFENEHYPMWNTVFEAKDNFTSEKIINDIDGLYNLGIGVIAPTGNTNACLFIAGCGYDFYDAHWIPLFERWGWIDTKKIERVEREKEALAELGICKETKLDLMDLARDKKQNIKRHAEGLLKALGL